MSDIFRVNKSAYKASEPFFQRVKMTWKLIKWLFIISFILHIIALLTLAKFSDKFRLLDFYYLFALYASEMLQHTNYSLPMVSNGSWTLVRSNEVFEFLSQYSVQLKRAVIPYYAVSLLPFIFMIIGFGYFKRAAYLKYKNTHLRGARLISEDELNDNIYYDDLDADLYISDKVLIPKKYETHHIVLLGKPGTGKTVVISKLIEQILNRGDKAIIVDSKVDFIKYFFRQDHDILMNPFDKRGLKINLLEEIEDITEIDEICKILIPDNSSNDIFWVNAPRELLNAILTYCYAEGQKNKLYLDNEYVYRACSLDREHLYTMALKVGKLKEANTIKENNPTSASIIQVFRTYITVLKYMGLGEKTFSLKDWVNNDADRSSIFIPNYAKISAALTPIITVFYYLASNHILSLNDSRERRIWLFADEFSRLQKIGAMHDILSNARSKGGCYVLGAQSIEKIMSTYGEREGRSLLDNIGNTLIFNLPDEKAAEYGASRFGKKEFIDINESISMGYKDVRDGATLSEQRKSEYIVYPTEIQYLQDLHYYLKFSSYYPCLTNITPKDYEIKNEGFIKRDEIILEKIYSKELYGNNSDNSEPSSSAAAGIKSEPKKRRPKKTKEDVVISDLTSDIEIKSDIKESLDKIEIPNNDPFNDFKTELGIVEDTDNKVEEKHSDEKSLDVFSVFNSKH